MKKILICWFCCTLCGILGLEYARTFPVNSGYAFVLGIANGFIGGICGAYCSKAK
jgi:hypothetical protein